MVILQSNKIIQDEIGETQSGTYKSMIGTA